MTRIKVLSSPHLSYRINDDDHNPPHIHVESREASVRINLITLKVMDSQTDFSASTLRRILEIVRENRSLLLDEWEKKHGQG
jgi:hypothetical protein